MAGVPSALIRFVKSVVTKSIKEFNYTLFLAVRASCKTVKLIVKVLRPSSFLRTLTASVATTFLVICITEVISPQITDLETTGKGILSVRNIPRSEFKSSQRMYRERHEIVYAVL